MSVCLYALMDGWMDGCAKIYRQTSNYIAHVFFVLALALEKLRRGWKDNIDNIYSHMYIHACMRGRMYVCMYVRIYTHICIYEYMYIHVFSHIYTCVV